MPAPKRPAGRKPRAGAKAAPKGPKARPPEKIRPAAGAAKPAKLAKAAKPSKARPAAEPPKAAPKVRAASRPAAPLDEAAQVFLTTVRAHDVPAKDVGEGWAKATKLPILTVALVGAAPTPARSAAVLGLLRRVREELAAQDREAAEGALATLEAAMGAPETRAKNRAAFELAERRDRAVIARRPALAAFVDALSHTAEAVASHADGDDESPPRRGLEVGRALLFAVAEQRTGDGESLDARRAASRELVTHLRRLLPGGPWA